MSSGAALEFFAPVQRPRSRPSRIAKRDDAALCALAEDGRHAELLATLTMHIAMGRASDVLFSIDLLRSRAQKRGQLGLASQLQVLRVIAGLETTIASSEAAQAWDASTGVMRAVLDFGVRVLPILREVAAECANQRLSDQLMRELHQAPPKLPVAAFAPRGIVSERELEVLQLVAIGLSNRAIGNRLYISEGTVKKHLASIMTKLRAANRTEAVDHGRRLGLVP